MMASKRRPAIAVLTALVVALAATTSATQRALLVAVGDYPGSRFDLEGPAHDVSALRRELVESLGFAPDEVDLLVDADATRTNILTALRKLADAATHEDFIFLYFSSPPFQRDVSGSSVSSGNSTQRFFHYISMIRDDFFFRQFPICL